MKTAFDYSLNYPELNLRKYPQLYRVGKGEQGVLLVEPYKSEILPHWRFKTPAEAKKSSSAILRLFRTYLKDRDFVGMDMARKFLQMGYTRSRRYANHSSGKKYDDLVPKNKKGQSGAHGRSVLPLTPDATKAEAARIFYEAWKKAESYELYKRMKLEWKTRLG